MVGCETGRIFVVGRNKKLNERKEGVIQSRETDYNFRLKILIQET